ncbi:hypothetical protein M3223_15310 [Paenibacillus pasadenensis]|uniref:hypothetical protein n=1 Tax=Paenibacillus pasadenensis TaxID=217090 RepID=UPI002040F33B|nr:hypothetical protein [Paenibacillus pasadenensis]MCM3748719.1 hypothetical protein [Paenibacillus pasadenensis]
MVLGEYAAYTALTDGKAFGPIRRLPRSIGGKLRESLAAPALAAAKPVAMGSSMISRQGASMGWSLDAQLFIRTG